MIGVSVICDNGRGLLFTLDTVVNFQTLISRVRGLARPLALTDHSSELSGNTDFLDLVWVLGGLLVDESGDRNRGSGVVQLEVCGLLQVGVAEISFDLHSIFFQEVYVYALR